MYARILVPVDLAHADQMEKANSTAAACAKSFGATVRFVGVTAAAPGQVAHTPEEYAQKLDAYALAQASAYGITADAKSYVAHDPSADLNEVLLTAIDEAGADLVVMATHAPSFADHLFPSHGGSIAARSAASVFVVR